MRTVFLLGIMILLTVGAVNAQFGSADVEVDILKYDPSPAEPGKFLDLWLSITNKGAGSVSDYKIELVSSFPFFLEDDKGPVREFAFIDSDGARATYKLRVAEEAPNGDATLSVIHHKIGQSPIKESLTISILGKVEADITDVSPSSLTPGRPEIVTFNVTNNGQAPVRDLLVTWTDPASKILPFADENRFRISQLEIGDSVPVSFKMIADPSITQGVHVINVDMSFQRFGESDSRTAQVAFIVGGLTDFDVAQQDFDQGRMSLSVANIGVNTATGVLITIPEQPGWKIIGGSGVFLGNLNPGDFTVASLQLQPLTGQETQTLKTIVDYTDTTGIRQSISKELTANLVVQEEESEQGANPVLIVVLLVVILIIVWKMRKRFSKRSRSR